MGEVFKGLTIKIGADTTNVQLHLKNLNTSLKATQKSLRTIEAALKFDSSNVSLLASKFSLTREELVTLSAQADQFRRRMQEIEHTVGLEKIRSQIGTITTTLANARTNVVKYDAELENVYRDLEKLAKEHGVAFEKGKTDIPQLISKLESYGENLTELKAKWEQLRAAQKLATEERDTAKLISEYRNLGVQVEYNTAKIKDMATHLKTATSYVGRLTTEMKSSAGSVKTMDGYISTLNSRIKTTQTAYEAANTELKAMRESLSTVSKESKEAFAAEYARTYAQTIDSLKTKIATLNEKYSALGQAAKQFSTSSTTFQNLAKASESVKEKLTAVETEIAQISAKLVDAKERLETFVAAGDTISADYRKAQEEVTELASRLEAAELQASKLHGTASQIRAGFEMSSVNAELKETQAALKSLESTASVTNGTLRNLGITMTATLSASAYMFFFRAAEAAQELDSAYRNMRKTVNATEQEYEKLYQTAVKYGETHITSAAEILEIEALGGQLGIAADQLEDFAKTVSNLDIAIESVDSDELAESLGKLSNQFQWTDGDMEKFGDSLTRLGNNMPTTEDKIIDITGRLSSMASIVGMTTQETLAWSTALASTTQGAESAATGLSKTISKIETAVATGGDSLESFASIAGMSADAFAEAWETSPSDALRAFIQGLKELDSQGISVDATLQGLGITSVRQKEAIQNLVQTIDTLDDAMLMSADAWDGISDQWGDAGDAANEAAKKAEGFSGALTTLENAASALGATIMDSVTPILQAVGTVIAALNDAISPMPNFVKEAIVAFAGMTVAVGPVLNLYAAVKNLSSGFKTGLTQTTVLQKAVNSLKTKVEASTVATKANAVAVTSDTTAIKSNTTATKAKATAEKAATTTKESATSATKLGTAAEKLDTAAKESNTVASKLNATAQKTVATATKASTTATKASTTANKASTASMTASMVAAKALNSSLVTMAASSQIANKALMTVAPIAGIMAAVAAINLLAEAVNAAAEATKENLGTSLKEVKEQIKETKAAVAEINEEYARSTANSDKMRELAQQYYEIAKATGETASTSTELYSIQVQLAAVSGELKEQLFDGEEALEVSADAMLEMADAAASAAENTAALDSTTSLYEQQTTAAENVARSEEALNKVMEGRSSVVGLARDGVDAYQVSVMNWKSTLSSAEQELDNINQQIEEYTQKLTDDTQAQLILDDAVSQATQGLMNAAEATEYVNNALAEAGLSAEEYGVTLSDMQENIQSTATAMEEELSSAIESLCDDIDTAIESDALLGAAFQQAGVDTQNLAELLNATGQSVDDFTSKVYDDVNSQCLSWDKLSQNTDNNMATLSESLAANAESMTDWYNDLTTIFQYANETGNENLTELATQLQEGGYEAGSVTVEEMANAIRNGDVSAVDELATKYGDAFTRMSEAEYALLQTTGQDMVDSLNQGVETAAAAADFTTVGTQIATNVGTGIQQASLLQMPLVGQAVVQGLADGSIQNAALLDPVGQQLGTTLTDATKTPLGVASPSTVFMAIGTDVVAGLAQGIEAGAGDMAVVATTLAEVIVSAFEGVDVSDAGGRIAQSFVSGALAQSGSARSAGTTLGTSFTSGISSKTGAARTSGTTMGTNFVSGLTSKASAAKTAGTNAAAQYVAGIASKYSTATSNGKTLANNAINGIKSMASSFKSAGSTAGSNYASGISSKTGSASSAGRSLANSALSGARGVTGYSAGYNFGIGYANGISSTSSYVYSRAYSLALRAVAAANEAGQSHSPSRVAMKIGAYFGEGYGIGIESQEGYVSKAATELVNTAIDASELGANFAIDYAEGIESQYNRLKEASAGAAEIIKDAFSNTSWKDYSNYATYAMYEPNLNAANASTAVNVNLDGYLTKEDVYSAFVSALKAQQTEVTLNIDGRAFANAIATSQDSVNGKRQSLVARGVAL